MNETPPDGWPVLTSVPRSGEPADAKAAGAGRGDDGRERADKPDETDEPDETAAWTVAAAPDGVGDDLLDGADDDPLDGEPGPGTWDASAPEAWGAGQQAAAGDASYELAAGDEGGPAEAARQRRPRRPRPPRRPRQFRRPRPPRGPSPWRTAFFGLAVLAVVAGAGWALLGGRLLVVRSVSVSGTHLLAPGQVTAAANVPVGTPLVSVDTGAVASRVEAIRQVASATVTRGWPDGLTISVTERVPLLAVKMAGGGYDQVDKAGVIVRWTRAKPALPVLTTTLTGAQLSGSAAADAAAAVLGELQPGLAARVTAVKPTTVTAGPEQVTLTLRGGQTVVWGDAGDAALKNRELAIILPAGARHIDVSAPGTVVTRLFAAPPPGNQRDFRRAPTANSAAAA